MGAWIIRGCAQKLQERKEHLAHSCASKSQVAESFEKWRDISVWDTLF